MAAESVITKEFDAIKTCLEALVPLDANQRTFVLKMVLTRLGMSSAEVSEHPRQGASGSSNSGPKSPEGQEGIIGGETIKDFLKRKLPKTEAERLVCIAYYLTHASNTSEFSTRDINTLNSEAHQPAFANASVTIGNAVRQSRFLCQASNGQKKITTVGEALVEALPDREKLSDAVNAARPRASKSKKKSRRAKK